MANRKIQVDIVGDDKSLNRALKSSQKSAKDFEGAMHSAAVTLGDTGKNTEDLSRKLGGLHSLLGTGIGTAVAATAVTAGVGIGIELGKSALEITEQRDKAERSLAQAIEQSGGQQNQAHAFLEQFIGSNRRFVKSQAEVVSSYATLIRSGLSEKESMRDLNIALDLATLKHIPLAEATDLIAKAEHGRMRGLVDLGIVSKDLVDADGNLIAGTQGVAGAMDALEAKTRNGRQAQTELEGSTNALNNDWQDLATKAGPPLLTLLDQLVTGADDVYQHFDAFGKDDSWWKGLNDGLINVLLTAQQIFNLLSGMTLTEALKNATPSQVPTGGRSYRGQRQAGGPVTPGGAYLVGEHGPEMLVMGSNGGQVIPNGHGGGNVIVHVHGSVMTQRDLVLAIREGIRRAEREQR